MMEESKALVIYVINKIFQQLQEDTREIKIAFNLVEYNDIDIFLHTKRDDDENSEISFTVEAIKHGTDEIYTNYVYNSSKEDLIEYIQTEKCSQKVLQCITNLILKVRG